MLPQIEVPCPACGEGVNAVLDGQKARWACTHCQVIGVTALSAIQLPLLQLPFFAMPPASA
jgi:ribosomal protein S27AE